MTSAVPFLLLIADGHPDIVKERETDETKQADRAGSAQKYRGIPY